jgi:hypothetical protein
MAIAYCMIVGTMLLAGTPRQEAPLGEAGKRSYALGMAVGTQLRAEGVDVDADLYHQGLKDALSGGTTRLTQPEARAALQQLKAEVTQRKQLAQGERGLAAEARAIEVSFMLDPRLTKGLYMGERWIASATYSSTTAAGGEAISVEARARPAGGAAGERSFTWTASNPEIVQVSPREHGAVMLTVRPAGASTVTVSDGEVSSTFDVKATPVGDRWRVDMAKVQRPHRSGTVAAAAGRREP